MFILKRHNIITFVHWAIKKAPSPICSLLDEVGQGKGKHLICLLGSSPEHLTFTLEKKRADPAVCPRLRHLLPNVIMSYTALRLYYLLLWLRLPWERKAYQLSLPRECSILRLHELRLVQTVTPYSAVLTAMLQITIILFKECRKGSEYHPLPNWRFCQILIKSIHFVLKFWVGEGEEIIDLGVHLHGHLLQIKNNNWEQCVFHAHV